MYRRKTIERWKHDALLVLFVFLLLSLIPNIVVEAISVDLPPWQPYPVLVEKEKLVMVDEPNTVDEWVDEAVNHYFDDWKVSEVKMIMHCLLHRESGHGAGADKRGDNGKAIGLLQFHNPTWNSYRKIMIERGEAVEIGDIHNFRTQIWTTVWAISDNRALAWGPILRDSQGSDYAACQTPSWY